MLAGACESRNECDVAQEKRRDCNAQLATRDEVASYRRLPLSVGDDCSGDNACVADCVAETTCQTLEWVMLGGQYDLNSVIPKDAGRFSSCIQACYELSMRD